MNSATNDEQRIQRIRNYIDRMPSLSTTMTKVLEICNRPAPSPNDLNRVISLDPVLTGQVLKLINSAYYSLPNHITSLSRAIIMLGINTVKNLALSTAVVNAVGQEDSFPCIPMDKYWTHSLCVGVTAKILAAGIGIPATMQEEFFVAGLLHDLGKIPLSARFPPEYNQALDLARLEQGSLHRAEQQIFGLNHCLVGKMIAEKWQLNNNIIDVLNHHHHPAAAAEENRHLITLVAAANAYANLYEIALAGDPDPDIMEIEDILNMAGFNWDDLSTQNETIQNEINKAQVFLKVSQG